MLKASSMPDLVIRGATCVTPQGMTRADVGVTDGKVVAIGEVADAREVLDARNLHLLPGVIDSHVHFREPGLTHKEDIASGSAGAALGGVVGYFEMPNTAPATTTLETLAWKVARARATSWVDFAFYVGATADNTEHLALLEKAPGACGVKMFLGSSTGDLLVDDLEGQIRVLQSGVRRIACHCEDEARLHARKVEFVGATAQSHPLWRDAECAILSTRRLIELAQRTRRDVHVLHVSTAEEVEMLSRVRGRATFEVTPQHLTLAAPGCYDTLGTLAQMNPPIRNSVHQQALWAAVRDGIVDTLGSDHAPHTKDEKSRPWPTSPSGIPGVQTLVPIMLNHVAHGRLSLERFVEMTSANVARVFGLSGKGQLAVGFDADFTLVDLGATRRISDSASASRCGWTPFDGMKVRGWPVGTIVRGNVVMWQGELAKSPQGRAMRFDDAASAPRV